MGSRSQAIPGVAPKVVVTAMVGWAGLAACLALVFLAMRSVMDVGGACADGGPYVSAQPCPDGAGAAMLLGIFGGMASAVVASIGGMAIGGAWAATPILAWSGLFGSLGWNFLDYGVLHSPTGGIEWGWAVCGVLFWAMAGVPLLGVLPLARLGGPRPGPGEKPPKPHAAAGSGAVALAGPGQAARTRTGVRTSASPGSNGSRRSSTATTGAEPGRGLAHELEATVRRLDAASSRAGGPPAARGDDVRREALSGIAAGFGAAIGAVIAAAPMDPDARPAGPGTLARVEPGAASGGGFTEGTQALLDRLERLADMRDRGLLDATEFETAKATIVAELEGRA